MQEAQAWDDFGRVETGAALLEAATLLDMEHEISTVQVLHHEEQMRLGLEGAEQVAEVGVLRAQREHLPLDQRALHVVVLQHDVFLQALDGVVTICSAEFCQ